MFATDVFEGVHDNTHNQMTWHTGPNCNLTVTSNFTGTSSAHTSCFSFPADNSGCAVIDWSRASYGPQIIAQLPYSIPNVITQGAPDPTGWGQPASELLNDGCDIASHFQGHSIVFDITTCGGWAGSSFGTSGCLGTCGATNSLHVYQQRTIIGVSSAAPYTFIPLGSAFFAAVFSLWSTF
ncbi:glycoside hydrolase family 16 protein [Sphaerobolus stellatus SS14]|uniref:Glycoside hydrolase family 16 protein n=1 Tax=Sphaerobolus stellatus (strain SS14) TaxID=990650 RepID=A0A0C9UMG0_SPHS4|nr:glycoside hydrolase family 16 protein [Sphaerobolus stellatus SS14]